MGFFNVEDGEGGSVEDRIAIIAVVAFAFCWIPIFLVWKCISVMRRKNGNQNGNLPVTTHNSDPEKHPYHPEAQPKKRTVQPAGSEQHQISQETGHRASRDVERRSSRGGHRQKDAKGATVIDSTRQEFDSAKVAHSKHANHEDRSGSNRHRERQGPRSSKRVHDVNDARTPSRHRPGQPHKERVRDKQRGVVDDRL